MDLSPYQEWAAHFNGEIQEPEEEFLPNLNADSAIELSPTVSLGGANEFSAVIQNGTERNDKHHAHLCETK